MCIYIYIIQPDLVTFLIVDSGGGGGGAEQLVHMNLNICLERGRVPPVGKV